VSVPQGHAPHTVELQRLQTFRQAWPTIPATTTSPTARRACRAQTDLVVGRGRGGAFPRVDREVNFIFGGHGAQENRRQQKLNDRQVLVSTTSASAPYRWSEHAITYIRADQWLNFDHPIKYPLLVDSVIRESRVKKVLVDWGSSINVTFPRTLQALGVAVEDLTELDTPFFGIMPTEGEYPLGHIYMSVTFGTPENYKAEFLRFEVAHFNYGYNTIIGRPGVAKFMAILHYPYMIPRCWDLRASSPCAPTSKAPQSAFRVPSK
jgi:hypothetical protein